LVWQARSRVWSIKLFFSSNYPSLTFASKDVSYTEPITVYTHSRIEAVYSDKTLVL